jgi:hypothetical protein
MESVDLFLIQWVICDVNLDKFVVHTPPSELVMIDLFEYSLYTLASRMAMSPSEVDCCV